MKLAKMRDGFPVTGLVVEYRTEMRIVMGSVLKPFLIFSVAVAWLAAGAPDALAQNTYVNTSTPGSWTNPSIWTNGVPMSSSYSAYIGEGFGSGGVTTATVTLGAGTPTTVANLYLGYDAGTSGTLNLDSALTITENFSLGEGGAFALNEGAGGSFNAEGSVIVSSGSLVFGSADTTSSLNVEAGSNTTASVTTSNSSNITGAIEVASAGTDSVNTLTLGSNLSLTELLQVSGTGATVSNPNDYSIKVGTLEVADSTSLTVHGGDVANSTINVDFDGVLTVQQTHGTGLTLNGNTLQIGLIEGGTMDLVFNPTSPAGWVFAWEDPAAGGNRESTLLGLINGGQIVIENDPNGYKFVDSGGYTYIEAMGASVPEPSSLWLSCLGTMGVMAGLTWQRWRGR